MQPHKTSLGRLGGLAFRRRRLVLITWIAALVVASFASGKLAGEFSGDYETPGSGSKAAAAKIAERFPGRRAYTVDVVWQSDAATSPGTRARMDRFLAAVQRLEGIGDGVTTRDAQVSRDGTVAIARVPISERRADDVPLATSEKLIEMAGAASRDGLRVELGGPVVTGPEQSEGVSSEAIGFMVAAFVLLLTFGTLVAAGMPLGIALFGLGISMALGGILAAVIAVPDWATQVAAMIGIGVGIDYALLIVTRYRTALARGETPYDATVEAVATAGRSVLVAGSTVVIALLGLLAMRLSYMTGVAFSASISVLVVMAAALTLLPALLGFAGHRINRLAVPRRKRTTAHTATPAARWSRAVQRRPWVATIAGVLVLAALTAPLTGMRLGFPDAGNDPASSTTRQAYDLTAKAMGPGANGPLVVVADVPTASDRAALPGLVRRLRAEDGVARVAAPELNAAGDTALIAVVPTTSPQDPQTQELVERLRGDAVPASGVTAVVGGFTASLADSSKVLSDRLPLFIGGVLVLSFLLLTAAFRAPVVAVKAAAMNLLSIAAAYGVVALVAGGGFAGGLVGIDEATPVPPFLPVIMFAILFGLSMDYEVFLLSRIREEYLARGRTSTAVAEGLARTARVITAAATIMVAVFGAFVLGDGVVIKLFGVGLATAVVIDATIVRMVLVPAVMQLLGDRNWWLPRWLDRSLPAVELEPAH